MFSAQKVSANKAGTKVSALGILLSQYPHLQDPFEYKTSPRTASSKVKTWYDSNSDMKIQKLLDFP